MTARKWSFYATEERCYPHCPSDAKMRNCVFCVVWPETLSKGLMEEAKKIPSLGGRRNVYAERYKSRGVTRFCHEPHTILLVNKRYSPNNWCKPSSVCG
jgi:hypothetical protein